MTRTLEDLARDLDAFEPIDKSTFLFVECRTAAGRPAFLGIEVKYHENLDDEPAEHRPRYDEVSTAMSCFDPSAAARLRGKPLQQIWRDHLLAGALKQAGAYEDAAFVFLYSRDNEHCARAVAAYQECLSTTNSFLVWQLEQVVACLRQHSAASWLESFEQRYLDFARIDRVLKGSD